MARRIGCRLLLICMVGWPLSILASDTPTVAAASSTQFALGEIAERFTETTGKQVRLNFGSSGNFRRQIAQGAPFELYLSANEAYVNVLYAQGHTEDAGALYARGRLVWLQRAGRGDLPSDAAPLAAVEKAIGTLAEGMHERIAMANPEHAPYGVAARQSLEHAGLWQAAEPLRLYGENISQAAQFALSSDARGGLVAYSLALSPALRDRGDFVLIPKQWHEPLNHRMALVRGAGETARAFYTYLQQDTARSILADYGFLPPPTEE